MHLNGLLQALTDTPTFQQTLTHLQAHDPILDQNVIRSARPFVVAALANHVQRPMLILTARADRAYNMSEQIPVWLPDRTIYRFAEPSTPFYERAPWSDDVKRTRLEVLGLFAQPNPDAPPPVVVASAHALMQKTLPKRDFTLGSRRLRVGSEFDPNKLIDLWMDLGYNPVTVVTQPGEFSKRGGIMDVFPPISTQPIRMEFFGDEIDSLRYFDPATQRSLDKLDVMHFSPVREGIPKHGKTVAKKLEAWFEQHPADDDAVGLHNDYEKLQAGEPFPNLEFYLPWLYNAHASLLDYLPQDALIMIDDWGAFRDAAEDLEAAAMDLVEEKQATNLLPAPMPLPYFTWDDLHDELQALQPIHLGKAENPTADEVLGDLFDHDQRFGGQLRPFIDHLHALRQKQDTAIVVTRQAEHVASLWAESSPRIAPIEAITTLEQLGKTNFVYGELGGGWYLKNQNLHLLTDAEIFGWKRPEPRRRQRPKTSSPESLFADLQTGDYVVHVEHGIARFDGLIKRTFRNEERELLKLEYGEGDVLFVPIHQAERITRYVGVDEDNPPKLNRLGTQEWIKIRDKASDSAEQIAQELLSLYAARQIAKGHAFAPDTPWQHELEASFPYVETDDQLRALRDVKADMEAQQPMDRLICGDVGYGKTEIALRAAFKAVMDGKQVAVLVPTTILAQQHYQNFAHRLMSFPVKVDMLSRFRTDKEQDDTLKKLASGDVDIIIGTHRLLSQDVDFKDLGLVVIDEEQRFGLTHKEQLKHLRHVVDVLTLTATPIPRTLYMSMTGIRDISTINTAPDERLPVATHVGIYDPKLVRQAILREIDRGGQVFFVHNRVKSIDTVKKTLEDLIPEASFISAHGQMNSTLLESIVKGFSDGDYDVLVSTSIIENGVDIPNANTIIVDRAEWFGLAALYQIRGRVGRSATQAYAYFFHPARNKLTQEAYARLETISEETQLGAGLAIALRDLEIRGAGDLLGKRQSGHIAAVGFHLYTQLLAQAVQKYKHQHGHPTEDNGQGVPPPLTVDLPLPTYIPRDYIPENNLRIQLYRRLADLHDLEQIDDMQQELFDRFGTVPQAVEGLLYQLRVKLMAIRVRATAVIYDKDKIGIKLPYLGTVDRTGLQQQLGELAKVSRTALWLPRHEDSDTWQVNLLDVLEILHTGAEQG